jgi:putative transposase
MRKHSPKEMAAALQGIEVLFRQGLPVAEAVQTVGITAVTYYRWRNQFGGLSDDQVARMMQLQAENARLRRTVAERSLERSILQEVVKKSAPTTVLRRALVDHIQAALGISERRACRVLGQHRSTQRKKPKSRNGYHAHDVAMTQ